MSRCARLDALRGYCVLGVFLFHAHLWDYGWVGVQIFFVLSGFLITGLLLNDRSLPAPAFFGMFYLRRALRIFPAYYAFLLVLLLAARSGWLPTDALARNYLAELPYLAAYVENFRAFMPDYPNSSLYSHLWTLSVEEQFYLIWPLAIWLTPQTRLAGLCFAAISTGVLSRIGLVTYAVLAATDPKKLEIAIPRAPLCAVDAFAIGALAMLALRGEAGVLRRSVILTSCGTLCAAAVGFGLILFLEPSRLVELLANSTQLETVVNLSLLVPALNIFAALLIVALSSPRQGQGRLLWLFDIRPLQRLGVISYGFYIYHGPAIAFTAVALKGSSLMIFFPVFAFSITIAAALISSRVVEAPFLSIKDRLSRSRSVGALSGAGIAEEPDPPETPSLALGRGGAGLVFPRAGG